MEKKKRKRKSQSKVIVLQEYPGNPIVKYLEDGLSITNNLYKTSIRLKIEASHEDWDNLHKYISLRRWEKIRRSEELISKYITTSSNKDLKIDAIVAAIADLNPETDFTGKGVPKVKAIEQHLGIPVSIKERALAWQRHKEQKAVLPVLTGVAQTTPLEPLIPLSIYRNALEGDTSTVEHEFMISFVIPALENSPEKFSEPWKGPHGTEIYPRKKGQHDNQFFIKHMKIAAALLHALFVFVSKIPKNSQNLLKSLIIPDKFPKNIRVQTKEGKPIAISCTACCLELVFSEYLKDYEINPFSLNLKRFADTYVYTMKASLQTSGAKILDLVNEFLSSSLSYKAPHIPDKVIPGLRSLDCVWELNVLGLIENLAKVYLNIHSPRARSPRSGWLVNSPHKTILHKAIKEAFPPRK